LFFLLLATPIASVGDAAAAATAPAIAACAKTSWNVAPAADGEEEEEGEEEEGLNRGTGKEWMGFFPIRPSLPDWHPCL
jgi:hypothetical protein